MRCAVGAFVGLLLATGFAFAQPSDSRLKTIQETATLRIAYRHDSRPFSYVDPQGRPVGYTVELCEHVAKSLEKQLKVDLTIKWVPVDTRTRFKTVADGLADMECGSTTISLSRMKLVGFSSAIFAESTGMLVQSDKKIFSFNDMAGKKIGVIPGTTNAQAIRNQLRRRKLRATLVEVRNRQEGTAALLRDELDGLASDKLVLLALVQAENLRSLRMLSDDLSFEPFAIVVPRGDWAFRLAVNTVLARIFRSGDIVKLYTKYFGNLSGVSNWAGKVFVFGGLPE